jgi:hypothetical protein
MAPRGLRDFNPLNIRLGDPWYGAVPNPGETAFVTFESMPFGVRAAARLLRNYQDKYRLDTLAKIIGRWAPPSENDTAAYVADVSQLTGFGASVQLDLRRPSVMGKLIRAMSIHENGIDGISVDDMRAGLKLAGIDASHEPADFSNVVAGVASSAPQTDAGARS